MEKLIVLGTGNAQAIHCYNTCFAMKKDEEYFLTDAGGGNGILLALEKQQIPVEKIHHIFVTHAHNDHILGMIWMVRMIATSINKGNYEGVLHIYCHRELVDIIKTLSCLTIGKKFTAHFDERILFHVVENEEQLEILGDQFLFFDIGSTKEKQFGYRIEMSSGITLAFPGDEPYHEALLPYVQGAHWLLHEAFCLYGQRDRFKPYEKHHSTVMDASRLADELHIPNLVLWHTEDRNLADRKKLYMEEARISYHGNLFVPDDGEELFF